MKASTLGLEGLGELVELLEAPSSGGAPRALALDCIDEDPHQPRTTFDPKTLDELAETIRERGVKTPISVRPNPHAPGRFLINHGARRYRASLQAGRATIPAFVDEDYSAEDQIVENLQRDALTAREIAEFIGRLLSQGRKKGDIARAIGKSPAYVTQHVALLDLPEALSAVFTSGRCGDVTVMNELLGLHRQHPEAVEAWIEKAGELTRGNVKAFRQHLESPASPKPKQRLAFFAVCEGERVEVLLRQSKEKHVWVKDVAGKTRQVPVAEIFLCGVDAV